jgi:hypothetical protein
MRRDIHNTGFTRHYRLQVGLQSSQAWPNLAEAWLISKSSSRAKKFQKSQAQGEDRFNSNFSSRAKILRTKQIVRLDSSRTFPVEQYSFEPTQIVSLDSSQTFRVEPKSFEPNQSLGSVRHGSKLSRPDSSQTRLGSGSIAALDTGVHLLSFLKGIQDLRRYPVTACRDGLLTNFCFQKF